MCWCHPQGWSGAAGDAPLPWGSRDPLPSHLPFSLWMYVLPLATLLVPWLCACMCSGMGCHASRIYGTVPYFIALSRKGPSGRIIIVPYMSGPDKLTLKNNKSSRFAIVATPVYELFFGNPTTSLRNTCTCHQRPGERSSTHRHAAAYT